MIADNIFMVTLAHCLDFFLQPAIHTSHQISNINSMMKLEGGFSSVSYYASASRAGFSGGPQASHQHGISHQTPQFLKPRNLIANPGLHNFCYHLCIVK